MQHELSFKALNNKVDPNNKGQVNKLFNDFADTLHSRQKVADLDEFKSRDHHADLHLAARGDSDYVSSMVRSLIGTYKLPGFLRNVHDAGKPLGPIADQWYRAAIASPNKRILSKNEQLKHKIRTAVNMRGRNNLAQNPERIDARVADVLANNEKGIKLTTISRNKLGIPVNPIAESVKRLGGFLRKEVHPSGIGQPYIVAYPKGVTPETHPILEKFKKLIEASKTKGPTKIAEEFGLSSKGNAVKVVETAKKITAENEKLNMNRQTEPVKYAASSFGKGVNEELNKVADRLHAKQGIPDLAEFKQQDHYSKLLRAVGGNEDHAADVATLLLYGKKGTGYLESQHRPGTPLGPHYGQFLKTARSHANRIENESKSGIPFSELADTSDNEKDRDWGASKGYDPANPPTRPIKTPQNRLASQNEYKKNRSNFPQERINADVKNYLAKNPGSHVNKIQVGLNYPAAKVRTALEQIKAKPRVEYIKHMQEFTPVLRKVTKYYHPDKELPKLDISDIQEVLQGYRDLLEARSKVGSTRALAKQLGNITEQKLGDKLRKKKKLLSHFTNFLSGVNKPEQYAAQKPTHSDFVSALRRIRSKNQEVLNQLAAMVAQKVGVQPLDIRAAIHDTPSTASSNTVSLLQHDNPTKSLLSAAYYGLLSQSRSLCVFDIADNGPDAVYRATMNGSGDSIRQSLDQHGITQRTMIPHASGWSVLVYDKGRQLGGKFRTFAQHNGIGYKTVVGTGRVIGNSPNATADSNTREDYRNIINSIMEQQENSANTPT